MKNLMMMKIKNKKNNNKKYRISYPFSLKREYNSIIPFNLFQTWHSKVLPPLMGEAVNYLKNSSPRFQHHLYDDTDCRNSIQTYFDERVLRAYDTMIPGAYKADLWRYCILYVFGGIYLDIKYIPVKGFRLIHLTEQEHWVLDIGGNNIYNAVIVSLPKNPILLQAINKIVENVENRYYGGGCLDVTGPGLLSPFFTKEQKGNMDMNHALINDNCNFRVVNLHNTVVLRSYTGYLEECKRYQKVEHYNTLWRDRRIYK